MSQIARFFLLTIAPLLAVALALLGIKTLPANPLGWFLLLIGMGFVTALIIVLAVRPQRFWESPIGGTTAQEEQGDRSFWFFTLGMIAVFYLSPLEYIEQSASLPQNTWMSFSGVGLVTLGIMLFVWARRALGKNYSGHLSVKADQTLIQSGPYRLIRHPAYAGYLLMALGISLGYSSLAGLASFVFVLLPSLAYRISKEENLLSQYYGEAYHQYKLRTKRLIPWIL
jgi:protein-S-isoprenylcysteine O-methyltransferase Ste14